MKKFFKHDNIEVLQYLGRAYVKAGNFKKAKTTFLKVRKNIVCSSNIAIKLLILYHNAIN